MGKVHDLTTLGPEIYNCSFQDGPPFLAESPIDRVWKTIERFTSKSYLDSLSPKNISLKEWKTFNGYVRARVIQALELRESARSLSFLSRPIPLYYAVLNLYRAFYGIKCERECGTKHGLRFKSSKQILSMYAEYDDSGHSSIRNVLDSFSITVPNKYKISLRLALNKTIEIANDIYATEGKHSEVLKLRLSPRQSGEVALQFNDDLKDFRRNWEKWFPNLISCCKLYKKGNVLIVNNISSSDYANIVNFANQHLEPELRLNNLPTWYIYKAKKNEILFPRFLYYVFGLFILSNLSRYNPESLIRIQSQKDTCYYIINQFLDYSERFLPHLLLNWIHNKPVWFGIL
ncbi:MAG TPA: YaaC family protein [Candidatus Wujingus californicus]|uniref:YaaC family protein n=1 Tax=Candidatus Wujingus californicus TaxID=3367618 RepID=UPI001D685562|nr:hypothetical protein [Planctomycetota bacterium]MDO8132078.1 YaaC family protein [Candidatus Brocadiales bacterium]